MPLSLEDNKETSGVEASNVSHMEVQQAAVMDEAPPLAMVKGRAAVIQTADTEEVALESVDPKRRGVSHREYIMSSSSDDEDEESAPSDSNDSEYVPCGGGNTSELVVGTGHTTCARTNVQVGPSHQNTRAVGSGSIVGPPRSPPSE